MKTTIKLSENFALKINGRFLKILDREQVGVLVFNSETKEVLVRKEIKPCWMKSKVDGLSYGFLTGTVDEGYSAIETAKKELLEEGGVIADVEEILELGAVYKSIFQSTRLHLYAVDVVGKQVVTPITDGSEEEAIAKNVWMPISSVVKTKDGRFLEALFLLLYTTGINLV